MGTLRAQSVRFRGTVPAPCRAPNSRRHRSGFLTVAKDRNDAAEIRLGLGSGGEVFNQPFRFSRLSGASARRTGAHAGSVLGRRTATSTRRGIPPTTGARCSIDPSRGDADLGRLARPSRCAAGCGTWRRSSRVPFRVYFWRNRCSRFPNHSTPVTGGNQTPGPRWAGQARWCPTIALLLLPAPASGRWSLHSTELRRFHDAGPWCTGVLWGVVPVGTDLQQIISNRQRSAYCAARLLRRGIDPIKPAAAT